MNHEIDEKKMLNGFLSSGGIFVFFPSIILLGFIDSKMHWVVIMSIFGAYLIFRSYEMYSGLIIFGGVSRKYVISLISIGLINAIFLYLSRHYGELYSIGMLFSVIFSIYIMIFKGGEAFRDKKEFVIKIYNKNKGL